MSCPDEGQLIRLIAGELEAGPADRLRGHLGECDRCAGLLAELQATWRLMEAWQEDEASADLWPTLRPAVESGAGRGPRWIPSTRPDLLRAAASIALAVGLGWTAGAWITPPLPAQPEANGQTQVEELVESLGLDEFTSVSATGLHATLMSVEESETETTP